jgi:hypothetical protein
MIAVNNWCPRAASTAQIPWVYGDVPDDVDYYQYFFVIYSACSQLVLEYSDLNH